MKRICTRISFWAVPGLLAAAALLTILGSSLNNDPALRAGIVSWLAASFLAFAWLVAWTWARRRSHAGGRRSARRRPRP